MSKFPQHFYGGPRDAWQVEGGHDADGKGPSIWDIYSHLPGTTYRGRPVTSPLTTTIVFAKT